MLHHADAFAQAYWSTAAERHWAGKTIEEQFQRSRKLWEESVSAEQAIGV